MSNTHEQLLAKVANLAGAFAILESEIQKCAGLIINPRDMKVGEIICNRLSFSQTLALIEELTEQNYSKPCSLEFKVLSIELYDVVQLEKAVKKLLQMQNGKLHSPNLSKDDPDEDARFLAKLKKGSKRMCELYDDVVAFKKKHLLKQN